MKAAPLGLCLPIVLLAAGCGSHLHPVRGKVTYPDGTPLDGGWVVFEKTEDGATHSADGPVQSDGTFELRTARPGDGVPAGKYRVLVKAKELPLNEAQKRKTPPAIHPKYERFDTSGLERVVEARENFFEITVTRP
jgi:hypothetical protein